jgi:hypothetical protein
MMMTTWRMCAAASAIVATLVGIGLVFGSSVPGGRPEGAEQASAAVPTHKARHLRNEDRQSGDAIVLARQGAGSR